MVTSGGEAMDDDDLDPKTKRAKLKNLEVLSVEALQEYIAELQTEIKRVETEIEKKQSWRSEAESFFKKPS